MLVKKAATAGAAQTASAHPKAAEVKVAQPEENKAAQVEDKPAAAAKEPVGIKLSVGNKKAAPADNEVKDSKGSVPAPAAAPAAAPSFSAVPSAVMRAQAASAGNSCVPSADPTAGIDSAAGSRDNEGVNLAGATARQDNQQADRRAAPDQGTSGSGGSATQSGPGAEAQGEGADSGAAPDGGGGAPLKRRK